jgi:hypothetical protein
MRTRRWRDATPTMAVLRRSEARKRIRALRTLALPLSARSAFLNNSVAMLIFAFAFIFVFLVG